MPDQDHRDMTFEEWDAQARALDESLERAGAVERPEDLDPGHGTLRDRERAAGVERLEELKRDALEAPDERDLDRLEAAATAAQAIADDALEAVGAAAADVAAADAAGSLLMANGYATIRSRLAGAIGSIEEVPLEAIEAAIAYAETHARRLKVDTDPRAGEAHRNAEAELEVLRIARHVRKRLVELAERQQARQRLGVTR